MRLNKIDLNLFVVFDTIYSEQNLSRAAEVLHITQPAVSNALSRLRKTLNDPLFVRTSQGMSPTPLAQNLIGTVREALKRLDGCVQQQQLFFPEEAGNIFRISISEIGELLLLPTILEHLSKVAPNLQVSSYYSPREKVPMELASCTLDVAMDAPIIVDAQLNTTPLIKDDFVCVVRENHPVGNAKISLQQYLELTHINVSSRQKGLSYIDLALRSIGEKRHIGMRAEHYIAMPQIISATDLSLSLPRRIAQVWNLPILELPFDVAPLEMSMYWHKNADQDPANLWFREQLLAVVNSRI